MFCNNQPERVNPQTPSMTKTLNRAFMQSDMDELSFRSFDYPFRPLLDVAVNEACAQEWL